MAHIGRRQVVLVGAHDRIAEVAVELIVVVQIGGPFRPDVRQRQVPPLAAEIARVTSSSLYRDVPVLDSSSAPAAGIGIEDVLVRALASEERRP